MLQVQKILALQTGSHVHTENHLLVCLQMCLREKKIFSLSVSHTHTYSMCVGGECIRLPPLTICSQISLILFSLRPPPPDSQDGCHKSPIDSIKASHVQTTWQHQNILLIKAQQHTRITEQECKENPSSSERHETHTQKKELGCAWVNSSYHISVNVILHLSPKKTKKKTEEGIESSVSELDYSGRVSYNVYSLQETGVKGTKGRVWLSKTGKDKEHITVTRTQESIEAVPDQITASLKDTLLKL